MAIDPDAFKQRYFTEIAPNYSDITGNATRSLFSEILSDHDLSITPNSSIHDNAAGPGTAAEALVSWCHQNGISPQITVTDYVPAMIDAFETLRARHVEENPIWQKIDVKVLDSADLSGYADVTFTHCICNFSIFTFTHPQKCLQEAYRTLQPRGIAVITSWKRFAVSEILAAAQDFVKGAEWGQAHRVPLNGPEYLQEGYTAGLVREAGWAAENVETFAVRTLINEASGDWHGLRGFLINSSIKNAATKDWGEEELAKWPEAVEEGLQKEKQAFGGILFEAWVAMARK